MRTILVGSHDLFAAVDAHLCSLPDLRPVAVVAAARSSPPRIPPCDVDRWTSERLEDELGRLVAHSPDVLLCVGWPRRLPAEVLRLPRLGSFNLHPSKLPAYRGRHPVHWAFIEGEDEVGVTLHGMTEHFDDGPILVQEVVPVLRDDDLPRLLSRLGPVACRVAETGLRRLTAEGGVPLQPAPPPGRYWPRRVPEHGRIDWTRSGRLVARLVNALVSPLPNAVTTLEGQEIRATRAFCGARPGQVLARTVDGRFVVAAGDGAVVLVELDREPPEGAVLGT